MISGRSGGAEGGTVRFRVIIDRERCKACELCVSVCPEQVLEMTDSRNRLGFHYPRVARPNRCTGCRSCAEICPDAAIEIEKRAG